jgi:protein SCO1/2
VNSSAKKSAWLIWAGLLLIAVTLTLVYAIGRVRLGAPVDRLEVYGPVSDFNLTNQAGKAVSLASLQGHVWVGDIIFTRCAGPCPRMTRQMKELQDALPAGSGTKLVTLTTDPDHDTPEVLKKYGERFGADWRRWSFLTGTKPQIAKLAIDSLKLTALEKKPEDREAPEDLFIHSTIFVLVDKQARLRGVFETTGEDIDFTQVKETILRSTRTLEKE